MSAKAYSREHANTRRRRVVAGVDSLDTSGGEWGEAWSTVGCVALSGGPEDGWWFHVSDWEARRRSAARMAEVHHRDSLYVASWALLYEPTGRVVDHKTAADLRARLWTWRGPAGVHSVADLVELARKADAR